MNLTRLLVVWSICTCIACLHPEIGLSQGVVLAMNSQADQPEKKEHSLRKLTDALQYLETHYKVTFMHSSGLLDDKQVATDIDLYKNELERTLHRLLDPLGLRFKKVSSRSYVISPYSVDSKSKESSSHSSATIGLTAALAVPTIQSVAPVLNSLLATSIAHPQFIVKGRVLDEASRPLPGVTVRLKGSNTIGSTTNADGQFTLNLPTSDGTLVISSLGYKTLEMPVNSRATIDVQLVPDERNLTEVVVVGYGTLDKKEVTSAISHISGEALSVVASNDPLMKLQGKISGLTVQNTGAADPNSTASIQLRGVASRSAGTTPLIVIDGVPGGNLQSVNENDIASIDVLKDGAASAIYGTRGSNGVILITTKRGKEGGGRVSYNGYTSFDTPTMTLNVLSADEFRDRKRGTDFGASTNWLDEVSRPFAFNQKHTVSFTGGGAKTTYRATVDFQDATGLDIRSTRRQYGARLGINHTGANGLYNIIFNAAPRYASSNTANRDAFTQALNLNPTLSIMDPANPQLYRAPSGFDEFNPVENLLLQQAGGENKYLDINATFKLNPTRNLDTQVQIAQVSNDNFTFNYQPSTMTTQIRDGNKGTASREYLKSDQYSFEWVTNYMLNRGKSSLKVLGVYSYQYFVNSGLNANNRDFASDVLTYNNLDNGSYDRVAGRNGFGTYKNDNRLISFRGRLNYSYDDKYLLAASLTRDGSSRFGANNKWGYFPGVSAGWRLSAEPFLKPLTWINDLKVRGDYGETGNQDFSNYQSLSRYQGFAQYMYNGSYTQVWGPANNPNPNLRWEKLKNWNIGVDFSLFNNRLSGSLNYYSRRAVDLLGSYNVSLPPNIITTTTANVGTMRSNGLEIDLSAGIVDRNDFRYNVSFNGATNNTVFVSFSNDLFRGQSFIDQVGMPSPGTPGNVQRLQEGERVGMFFFWKYAGVDEKGLFQVYNKRDEVIPASQAVQDDKRFVGNGLPKFQAGMTHTFTYKNWDASASLRGNFGYDIFNVHQFYYGLQSASANTNVLQSAYGRNDAIKGDKLLTDYFLEKGDFVKLDVVTLGYVFKINSKVLESVRLYGSTRNLKTFTKFTGVDPDTYPVNGLNPGILLNTSNPPGGTKAYYPSTTQLLFGLQVNLK